MRKWKRRGFIIFSGKKKNDFPGKWKEERKGRESGLRNRGVVVGMGNESSLT